MLETRFIVKLTTAGSLIGTSVAIAIFQDFNTMTLLQQGLAALIAVAFVVVGAALLCNALLKKED